MTALAREEIRLHGHRVGFRRAGSGPLLVLVHGIAGTADTWAAVAPLLAERFEVIAPDLLGHGSSAKPPGDYSLGAYASGVRDLLVALGHDSATVVGHSLGGGVAMQMAYQFPGLVERLALVSSGGLGREVSVLLRAAALPGAEYVLPLLAAAPLLRAGEAVGRSLRALGLRAGSDLAEMGRSFASLHDLQARQAFVHTIRAVLDAGGQRASALDRLYLAAEVPTLILWGERDPMIPVAHGRAAHELIPASRLEVFADAGHFPQIDDPIRFAQALTAFVAETEPAHVDLERIRELLRSRGGTIAGER